MNDSRDWRIMARQMTTAACRRYPFTAIVWEGNRAAFYQPSLGEPEMELVSSKHTGVTYGDKPKNLDEAFAMDDGHVAKFYLMEYAPVGMKAKDLAMLSCLEIRERIDRHLAHDLAAAFVRELRAVLTPDEFRQMRIRNGVESDPLVCHSHDFVDANMQMDAAFWAVIGHGMDGDSTRDLHLWTHAWDIAKARDLIA